MSIFILGLVLSLAAPCLAVETALEDLPVDARVYRTGGDLKAVRAYRAGLEGVLAFVRSKPDIFPPEKPDAPRLLDAVARETALTTWKTVLDYTYALDCVGRYHREFHRLKDPQEREDSLLITYAAFLAQYRFALEILAAFEKQPALDALLNEPAEGLGLSKRTYARYRFRFLNIARATEYTALTITYKAAGGERQPDLREIIAADSDAIREAGKFEGQVMTARNALRVIKDGAAAGWFPIQARVAGWMGDTKVKRLDQSLISEAQVATMFRRLEPGDVLLVRREWYLSNIGLPGFWPHAALYVGSTEERRQYFNDPAVNEWVTLNCIRAKNLEEYLEDDAKAYALSRRPQEHGRIPRVIEAISEGVCFTTLEHCVDADSLVVLRPRLSKVEKAEAIHRAFHLVGRPYDFNFDFQTDSALVCTELVYKAYEPGPNYRGLVFTPISVLGRMVVPANEIARQFAATYGTPAQQFDLVIFLDGFEQEKVAVESTADDFRESWKRPKWHVLTQDAAPQP
jgi:hypothetical protein